MVCYRITDDMEASGEVLAGLVALLPEWRRREALAFKHEAGQRECALSFLLLRDVLRERFGMEEPPQFSRGEHGKPEIPFPAFNMSHCRRAVGVAVSDGGSVGIDVECLGRYKPQLAEYCMNEEELRQIAEAEDADEEFTRLWTRKEALLKYTGEGITDDMKGCLASERAQGVTIESGCNREKGYAWSVAFRQ